MSDEQAQVRDQAQDEAQARTGETAQEQETVGGYAPVPPPPSVQDGGSEAQEAAEAGAATGADEEEAAQQGTGRSDG